MQDTNYASAVLIDSIAAPEPSTGLMVAMGLVGFAGIRKRERRLRARVPRSA